MMAQYIEIKAANPDSLLFYRMGDFYELFFSDAEIAARALGIALTKRGKHLGEDIPMCGVPVHSADDYLQKLIALGHRVAVCEQLENPAEAKKRGAKSVVKRDVVRLVTPGTITEDVLLEPGASHWLAALSRVRGGETGDEWGLAAVDLSTGEFLVGASETGRLSADLARLAPKELILPEGLPADEMVEHALEGQSFAVQPQPAVMFESQRAAETLQDFFLVATLDGFGTFTRAELSAASAVIAYLDKTQIGERPALRRPAPMGGGTTLFIDAATRANLELTQTLSGKRDGSLLHSVDRTVTAGGSRLLGARLAGPSTDVTLLDRRLDDVAVLVKADFLTAELRDLMKGTPDLPRAISRLALNRGGPTDLGAVAASLERATQLCEKLQANDMALSANLSDHLAALRAAPGAVSAELAASLSDELPRLPRDGGYIRTGRDEELDRQRQLSRESRQVIAQLQGQYAEATGVKGLKIRHNNVLGYFIEVTAINAAPLQDDKERFIHRQSMANAMRFTTTELAELESAIANAAGQALTIELSHFDRLRDLVLAHTEELRAVADAIAAIDVAAANAHLAASQGYVRPTLDDSVAFDITAGRHPVVEQALRAQAANPFVANDCRIGGEADSGSIWLLTGPNMGGKSTFLRQNALIAILAQMGAFVPAGAAHIGVIDRLFSRVGAADDLARGRSTFMVEMVETAAILNQAGPRSLVILDEIGRGTATFDGLSIAWAAIENLHETNRCRTLFATHYHELTALSVKLDRLSNVTMKVKEWNGDVVFLHEVGQGSADRSYGIQVAGLAGLPDAVIARAKQVLERLEAGPSSGEGGSGAATLIDELPLFSARPAPAPINRSSDVEAKLSDMRLDEMTPREAQEALYALKDLLPSK
ncbi:DNA mismatch repair protein MutS [Ahrensia sp. R2A130]|nr:DNA mismatch repair protein MutS [Ahrensia sp. R2A130]